MTHFSFSVPCCTELCTVLYCTENFEITGGDDGDGNRVIIQPEILLQRFYLLEGFIAHEGNWASTSLVAGLVLSSLIHHVTFIVNFIKKKFFGFIESINLL